MSTVSDALNGVRRLLLMQENINQLERTSDRQIDALQKLTDDVIALDKRVVRIETMIEIGGRQSAQQKRIEE